MRRLLLMLAALCALALPVTGQEMPEPATLVADRISVGDMSTLVAEGDVEIVYKGTRLRAARLVYDRNAETLSIEGPIALITGKDTVLLADSAALTTDLTEGILYSARMVLRQQLQLAAADIQRVAGRYTLLDRTVASSCRVCAMQETPLWQIRARRIIHDQEERQLYFDHARLELAGMPVFYLPRLRLPDPTLKRATGFLVPELRATNQLGTGLKIPFFLKLGPHRDLTLTPYLSTGNTRTLELRYRQALASGDLRVEGAISRDDLLDGETRYYLFADGVFNLPRDFKLSYDIEASSDSAYLLDYDYSDKDRLDSALSLTRARRDELITADIVHFKTLRDSETNATIPALVGDLVYRRRFVPRGLGGIAGLTLSAHGAWRSSEDAFDLPLGVPFGDGDPYGQGIDIGRISAVVDWEGRRVIGPGLVLGGLAELSLDHVKVADDVLLAGETTRLTPAAAVELRWPLARTGRDGAIHVLEPVVQLAWSREDDGTIPNEDSVLVEFDDANLFSLTRFAGEDAREAGLRANLGIGWTRHDPSGWSLALLVGRVWREADLGQFAPGSGLDGLHSDWLAAVELDLPGNLILANRMLLDGNGVTRNDLRVDWFSDRLELGSSLLWAEANLAENRPEDRSEWVLDAAYRFRDNWTGKTDWRYDFVAGDTASASLGLEYRNECITVDLSLSRRFTSSTTVDPSTDFGLTVSLGGFGAGAGTGQYTRRCTP
ncbi:LPS-assembly protein [Rhodovulum bhavnagarense]|uniref:LPS-assembly protein LptD n=1 Tax=Rhodovulum bhavnagarense TaxID=992286 RepID=A0A4R2RJJ8_9RHOB|nr:LPS assembly protein LptD [Rhodovulum bhavnagarense]TCP63253.1 LPS-assembly protein [Rhodovulum bhavnagarense]